MRIFLLLFLFPIAAAADCREEIAALFEGGPMDPFVQPPYRYVSTTTGEDGSLRYRYTVTFDTPLRSMTEMEGGMNILAIDHRTWSRASADDPWAEMPSSLPEDLAGFHRQTRDQLAANLTDPECPGTVATADGDRLTYRYRTRTGPNVDGSFFGGLYTIYIDPDTNQLMRQEITENVAHYQPAPGTDRTEMVYSYDPAISLSAPE